VDQELSATFNLLQVKQHCLRFLMKHAQFACSVWHYIKCCIHWKTKTDLWNLIWVAFSFRLSWPLWYDTKGDWKALDDELESPIKRKNGWHWLYLSHGVLKLGIGSHRAGPSRCGAQCKTWARGPMQDLGAGPLWAVISWRHVFSQPCYDRGRAQIYSKALTLELSTFANVQEQIF